jgi:hypothetical protein
VTPAVNPFVSRVAILITELMVFLMVTALMTYFISFASAPEFAAGAAPPADFPVIAYDGSRERPEPKNYLVVPWSEWEGLSAKRPGASLLLPERSATLQVGDNVASFTVVEDGKSRQTVELTWRTAGEERRARYATQGRGVEPRDFRTITSKTVILGGMAGFAVGMLIGQLLRRRLPLRPV